ncbi:MAG TPA: DUF302 domain-containing protein [Candidatus Paceibacterota bacterium]
MKYYYKKETRGTFEETLEKTKSELAKAGFGILTEIDVKATLKEKLDKEYDRYIILGACNPPLAYKALMAEKDIGLLLPCNVLVYEDESKTYVSAIVPSVAMSMVENPSLGEIAKEVDEKLKSVVDAV